MRAAPAIISAGPPGSTQLAPSTQPSPADTIVPGVPLTPRQPTAAAPAGLADAILSPVAADAGRGGGAAGPRTAPDSSAPIDDRQSGISIVADEQNNSVIVTATMSEWRRVRQILDRIDVAAAQVMLEATIAEVTLNDQLKLGMRWYFERNQSQFRLANAALGAIAPSLGFSYFLNSPNVQVVLNALATITDVNIVSSPTLMVLDNKKATLQIGDEVPYPTQSAVGVLAPGAPIVNSITSRSTGILLGITPRISDKGRVLLDIEQEVSEAVETTSSTLKEAPTIQQRRVRTTVAVSDGESIVLAGMMQDKSTRKRDQVPMFGSIPVVGNLFKEKVDTVARTELLIAITPRIVTDRVQMRGIVDEFRGKLNFNTRPQRDTHPDRREQLDRLQR